MGKISKVESAAKASTKERIPQLQTICITIRNGIEDSRIDRSDMGCD